MSRRGRHSSTKHSACVQTPSACWPVSRPASRLRTLRAGGRSATGSLTLYNVLVGSTMGEKNDMGSSCGARRTDGRFDEMASPAPRTSQHH